MPETFIVVRDKKLDYKGLFDPKGLYQVIQKLFKQHSFDWVEFKNSEHVYKDGKQIEMDLRPYKKFSDYVKAEIKMEIIATDLKEAVIEVKGLKRKMYKGHVTVTFTSFLITDYEASWETRPFYYLIRMLIDKYIYKGYIGNAKSELVSFTNEAYDEIRSFLNMHRYY